MTMYVKLSTMEFPRYPGDVAADPLGESDYAEVIETDPPVVNFEREFYSYGIPEQREGVWYCTWVVTQYPDEVGAKRVREKRNSLLSECDWTQLDDSPVNKQVWATYRQELRDVPAQPGFPWNVTWPVKP